MDNVKKLADFIDQNKTSDKSVDIFLRFLEVCLDSHKHMLQEG